VALHSVEKLFSTPAKGDVLLPANIVGQELHGIESGTAGKVAQRRESAPWTTTEELPP
jgi:hypothetical protein